MGPGSLASSTPASAALALAPSTICTSLGTSTPCARWAGPPSAQPTPTRIRLMPMIAMMVPVTTGGKKRSSRLMKGAMKIDRMPAPMIAPKIARAPSGPPCTLAIATIGPTAAKVTPIITGSLMPKYLPKPSDWISVTRPQQNRSAEMSRATCSGPKPSARPTIRGTATAPAYITSTCCMPNAASRPPGSFSSTGWTGSLPPCSARSDMFVSFMFCVSLPRRPARVVPGHRGAVQGSGWWCALCRRGGAEGAARVCCRLEPESRDSPSRRERVWRIPRI